MVKGNIELGELVIPKPTRKQVSISRKREYKMSDGNARGVVKTLPYILASQNDFTLELLKLKHLPQSSETNHPSKITELLYIYEE